MIGPELVIGLIVGAVVAILARSAVMNTTRGWRRMTRAVHKFTHGIYAWIATVGFVGLMIVIAVRTGA